MPVRLSSGAHRANHHAEMRPTAARTLESVFNILQDELEEKSVLDLFAGIGSYGIMAVRRGAQSSVLVDNSRESERRVLKAITQYHLEEQVTFLREDVSHFLHRAERDQQKFDLVFADPPYASYTPGQVIQEILECGVLAESGILIFEHSSHQAPPVFSQLALRKSRVFGETTVSIWDHA
jgi:16S rRNA (guanine966-N2)-methyltransferase